MAITVLRRLLRSPESSARTSSQVVGVCAVRFFNTGDTVSRKLPDELLEEKDTMGVVMVPADRIERGGEGRFGIRTASVGIKTNSLTRPRTLPNIYASYVIPGYFVKRSFSSKRIEDEWVDDFNKELELVFGSRPESPPQLGGEQVSRTNLRSEDLQQASPAFPQAENVLKVNSLSHVDAAGKASMVNVVNKTDSKRVAVASGKVFLGLEAFDLVSANNIAKGDVLTVAKIAGINGAKQTSSLIPLCHNILLSGVHVTLTLDAELYAVDIRAEVTTSGPTGVEMEALAAVSIASLTVYDMCKAVSKDIRISNVQLESKTGGKSGDWFR